MTKAVKIEEEINDLMNFNQVFGKNVAYDNLKVTKNHDFTVSLENIFWKNHRGTGEAEGGAGLDSGFNNLWAKSES